MESINEISASLPAPADATGSKSRRPRTGKNSRQRNQLKYRNRVNAQDEARRLTEIETKYKLFETDDTKQLEKIANTIQITTQKRAIPISVSTRSIGFATAIFYDRASSTWNLRAIAEIATIHQVYRVHLWLAFYKMYLAQQIQVEMQNADEIFQRIFISDEVREIMHTVAEVPSLISLILDSMGKIETSNGVYHSGFALQPSPDSSDAVEFSVLCLTPLNIRATVATLANPETPLADRQFYMQHNSIPGAHVTANLLMNPDEIYPAEYGATQLQQDVHAYKNLITRIQARLPKHTILNTQWNGKAAASGLWSGPLSKTRIESSFIVQPAERRTVVRRDVQGRQNRSNVDIPASSVFTGSTVYGERTGYWCLEDTPHQMAVVGIASLVGEECFIHTRYELGARAAAANTASTLLYAFSDAPR